MKDFTPFGIIILTLQFMCILMGFFMGWLGTKMEIPDEATDWWISGSWILAIIYFIGLFVQYKIDKYNG
jgi:hypothetical protein